MKAAQESADIYLESLRVMEAEYRGRVEKKEREATRYAEALVEKAERRAEAIVGEAERRAAAREALEKQTVEELWKSFKGRADQFLKVHAVLDEMIRGNPLLSGAQPQAGDGGADSGKSEDGAGGRADSGKPEDGAGGA
jgi:hypothetical protein